MIKEEVEKIFESEKLGGIMKMNDCKMTYHGKEIVLCEECAFYTHDKGNAWRDCGFCEKRGRERVDPDDFCSMGENKDYVLIRKVEKAMRAVAETMTEKMPRTSHSIKDGVVTVSVEWIKS